MSARRVIGITGGIATGKSTVLAMLRRRGIPVISADQLAREALRPGTRAYRRVLARYGRSVRGSRGSLSRKALAQIVFADPAERRWLERRIHPVVIRELRRFVQRHSGTLALDIPLLFEARLERLVDEIWVVFARRSQQLRRLEHRGLGRCEALLRLGAQMPLSRKCRLADAVIRNTGTLQQTRARVEILLDKLGKRRV